jgi:UDP-N-acetylglucosamine--N-acetylmuramyl-(pentapeptide) pyrophosphoryl-undecaprenol N-acetylglucosamine transferase
LSLARELKRLEPSCQITYIGHKGDKFDSLQQSSGDFDFFSFIDGGKFRRYHGESIWSHLLDVKTLALNFRDFFKVISSVVAAFKILRRVKPDVVFSKGGFVVVPVGIAARLLKIPIVTHDSDTMPGLANRIVGRWAVINATGMPARYYKYPTEKIRYVGVPVAAVHTLDQAEVRKMKKSLDLPEASQVFLVAGGGNGSKKLNDLTCAVAPNLLESNLALHIVHICGQLHEEAVKAQYKSSLPAAERKRVNVIGFTPRFQDYAAVADLVFSRAGATSLAEYALLGKACIIMPSPFLAGGHQLKNAAELSERDAAVVVDESTAADELLVVISELLNNEKRRQELGSSLKSLAKPDAAASLADIIMKTAKREKA